MAVLTAATPGHELEGESADNGTNRDGY